ncbi:MAG TPA: nitroreductase family protein [Anaeromyxobacteraceae bacterium]
MGEQGGERLALPPPRLGETPLARALAGRRSRREFGRRDLSTEALAALCWAAQGRTASWGGRTAPSAGGLHPLRLSVADVRGVWRYHPGRHALELAAAEDRRARLAAAALGQACVRDASAVFALTADPEVLRLRYRARAERYCTLEAGHAAQNLLLAAEALGLAAVPVAAFEDQAVLEALGLAPSALALYLVPAGEPA